MTKNKKLLELYKIQKMVILLKAYQLFEICEAKKEEQNAMIIDKPKVKVLTRNKPIK